MNKLIKRLRKIGFGRTRRHLRKLEKSNSQYIQRLEAVEKQLQFMTSDRWNNWLWLNKTERMDASLDVFDEKRRMFHLDRYKFAAQYVKDKVVLDCASGTGYGCSLFLNSGAHKVTGVDIDQGAIEYSNRKHHLGEKGDYICGSANDLPLEDECVDVLSSMETLEHLEDEEGLISEFARVLKPEGLLIMSTPNEWPLAIAPYHVREYDYNSFCKCVEPHFEVVSIYNQNSGSDSEFNRGQAAGIVETNSKNKELAECYIGVFRKKAGK